MKRWHVRRGEDRLLWSFWQATGGRLWIEVPIAGPPPEEKVRRIDAVIVPGPSMSYEGQRVPWPELDGKIIVVEAKLTLDHAVIGQVAAARVEVAALTEQQQPTIEAVVVVGPDPDPALRGVCEELEIQVAVSTAAAVFTVCFDPADSLIAELDKFRTREGLPDIGSALREAARRHLVQ